MTEVSDFRLPTGSRPYPTVLFALAGANADGDQRLGSFRLSVTRQELVWANSTITTISA
jgi:hypothetical protein